MPITHPLCWHEGIKVAVGCPLGVQLVRRHAGTKHACTPARKGSEGGRVRRLIFWAREDR